MCETLQLPEFAPLCSSPALVPEPPATPFIKAVFGVGCITLVGVLTTAQAHSFALSFKANT